MDLLAFLANSDPHPDVRCNAATGLARHGDARCSEQLIRMLDADNDEILAYEPEKAEHAWKRSLVMTSALRAAELLAQRNTEDDLTSLRQAIERLAEADVPNAVRIEAAAVLRRFDQREPVPAS